MVKGKEGQRQETRSRMRDGKGDIKLNHILEKEEMLGKARLFARITVEPGCSIGEHPHGPDAEIYYILSGEVVVSDNGVEKTMTEGGVMITGNGESHNVENRTAQPAELLAIVML